MTDQLLIGGAEQGLGDGSNSGFKLYTGLSNCQILCFNPNLKWLHENVSEKMQEPVYTKELGDPKEEFFQISVWVKEQTTKSIFNLQILVNSKEWESKNNPGKFQWTNSKGEFTWGYTLEDLPDWFSREGAIKSTKGQETFFKFIQRFLRFNSRNDGADFSAILNNWSNILKGDFTLMNQLLTAYPNNRVALLFEVSESVEGKQYQRINSRNFYEASDPISIYWVKRDYDNADGTEYPLTKNLITFDFQEFDKDSCVNAPPSQSIGGFAGGDSSIAAKKKNLV